MIMRNVFVLALSIPLLFACSGGSSKSDANAKSSESAMGALKAKRGEIPTNVKGIKTALIQYESTFDKYVDCSCYPAMPSKTTRKWSKAEAGGFSDIGWAPDGDVRGTYCVSTTATNFTVTGLSDIDGDSVYATYTATKSVNPNAPTTAADVY